MCLVNIVSAAIAHTTASLSNGVLFAIGDLLAAPDCAGYESSGSFEKRYQ